MNKRVNKTDRYSFVGLSILPVVLICSCVVINIFAPKNLKFPNPKLIFAEVYYSILDDKVHYALGITFLRLIESLSLALIFGIFFGYLLGYNRKVWSVSQPTIDFFRSIPVTFLIPVAALLIGSCSPYIILVLSTYPCLLIIVFSIRSGICQQEPERLHSFKIISGNSTFIGRFLKVTFYETLPDLFSGFRISLSYCIVIITVLEYMSLGNKIGIGRLVNDELINQNYPRVYALIFVLGIIGFLLNKITELIQVKYIHWSNTDNSK